MSTAKTKMDPAEVESMLPQFTGGGDQFHHWLPGCRYIEPGCRYTEGVKFLADATEAYWLINLVFSWQTRAKVRREPFQVWTLELTGRKDFMARAECRADSPPSPVLAAQRIPYTDFPLKSIKLYLCDGVLMLPSEYCGQPCAKCEFTARKLKVPVTHFSELVRAGALPGASRGQKAANRLAHALLDYYPTLDGEARKGFAEFAQFVGRAPTTAQDWIDDAHQNDHQTEK